MRGTVRSRPIALFGFAVFVVLATSMNTGAEAAPIPRRVPGAAPAGDHVKSGNGKGNVTTVSVRSPSDIRGTQNVADNNASTVIARNTALCKKRRFCRIRQSATNIGLWP